MMDLYDAARRPLGRSVPRGAPLRRGEHCLVASVWVEKDGLLLLTRRSAEKQSWPGYWENPGGLVQAGESSEAGCRRELSEETGLLAPEGSLFLLDSSREDARHAFFETYLLRWEGALPSLRLQPGETAEAAWLTPEEVDGYCARGLVAGPIAAHWLMLRERLLQKLKE